MFVIIVFVFSPECDKAEEKNTDLVNIILWALIGVQGVAMIGVIVGMFLTCKKKGELKQKLFRLKRAAGEVPPVPLDTGGAEWAPPPQQQGPAYEPQYQYQQKQ